MIMMVIAHRQLSGEYGHAAPGDVVPMRDEVAARLIKRGLVSAHSVAPDNKSVTPSESKRTRRIKSTQAD